MAHEEMKALAERFMKRSEAGDEPGLREIFAPNAEIWSSANPSGELIPLDTLLPRMKWEAENVKMVRDEVRYQFSEDGFVQQQMCRVKLQDGKDLAIPNCLVVRVVDGKIARLDDYVILPQPKAE